MGIKKRLEDTVDEPETGWRYRWGEALKNWMASWLGFGIEIFFDVLGKAFTPKLKPLIDSIEATGEVPPELQPILDEIKEPTGQIAALFGTAPGYTLVGGALSKLIDAMFLPLAYAVNSKTRNVIITEPQLLASWLRGDMTSEELDRFLTWFGHQDNDIDWLKRLTTMRLDPLTITNIWRRDKAKYEKFWDDLKHQGWTEDRIEVAKELAKIIPPLADMVRFADFGSFDPEIIAKWRDFYDAPSWIREPMSLIGIEEDWANKYWFSHWRQPGRFELSELHRRNLIDDDIVKKAYLTQGYSSFWQDLLLELVKEVPTRVDVRRFWDMRTIDEARLREIYHAHGYYDKDLDDYVLWTKVYVAFPDLIARWKNGWITEDEVRSELTALGMPSDRVDEMMETKIKKAKPERTAKERDLTKSEIVKGVKNEVITVDQGLELLQHMGYDAEEAEFILEISVGVLAGSPESYTEFKKITQLYRRAVGMEAKPVTEELKKAADEVLRLSQDLESLKEAIEAEERTLIEEEVLPEAATAKRDELRVSLHRAESALAQANDHYRSLLAQWRHGE